MSLVNVKKKERDFSKFGPQMIIILTEMCNVVGIPLKCMPIENDRWFMEFSWTAEQEAGFEKWLTNHFHTNREARKEIFRCYRSKETKKRCRRVAGEFTWQYGWSRK